MISKRHRASSSTLSLLYKQLRLGDVVLLAGEEGQRFFTQLKNDLDLVLTFSPVHYYFFAEAPTNDTNGAVDMPPPSFSFLTEIFFNHNGSTTVPPQRVSFLKHMGVKSTILHQMNADMVVTTGSSFPLIAVTISPKVKLIEKDIPPKTLVLPLKLSCACY